jgi:site-specific recombinase XerD
MNSMTGNYYRSEEQTRMVGESADLNINIYHLKSGRHVVCYIDPGTGRRIRKKFKSLASAKDHQRGLELKLQVKGLQAFATEPVARLMELHLDKCPNTKIRERKNSFVSFCDTFGHRRISDVGKVEVEGWLRNFQKEHDLSDRTLLTIKSQINHFFKFLKDEGVIQQSPLWDVKFKRNPPMRRPRVVLSVEEVRELLENARSFSPNYLYPFLYTVAHTGARKSEILKLERNEVDFNTGLLHLRKTKNGEDRSIRMPQNLVAHLKSHLESHESDFVFPNPDGNTVGRSQLARLMKRFSKHFPTEKKLGLHSLRHSFAYNYLKKGGEMYQLQAILGHKHIQVTVDLYGQLKAQDIENISPYEK